MIIWKLDFCGENEETYRADEPVEYQRYFHTLRAAKRHLKRELPLYGDCWGWIKRIEPSTAGRMNKKTLLINALNGEGWQRSNEAVLRFDKNDGVLEVPVGKL